MSGRGEGGSGETEVPPIPSASNVALEGWHGRDPLSTRFGRLMEAALPRISKMATPGLFLVWYVPPQATVPWLLTTSGLSF